MFISELTKHSNIARFYERLAKRKGSFISTVAAAAKLLKVAFWLMKEKREYQNHELQLRVHNNTPLGLRQSLVNLPVACLNKWIKTVMRSGLEWVISISFFLLRCTCESRLSYK
jgi:ABC-type multidrug transport system permease subunit